MERDFDREDARHEGQFRGDQAAISGTAADIAAAQAAALSLEVASAQSRADAMAADARAAGRSCVTYNLTTLAQSNASTAADRTGDVGSAAVWYASQFGTAEPNPTKLGVTRDDAD